MKQTTIVDYSDLLHFAVEIGIDWNTACDIMDRDEVRPMYECNQVDIYPGMGKDYGWSEESSRIVDGFMAKHNLTSATLVND